MVFAVREGGIHIKNITCFVKEYKFVDWDKVRRMKDEGNFFEHQSEQSMIKAKIVSSYFTAWSRIMCKNKNWSSSIPVGYVDLFSGPGVYQDGNESVPIMLIKTVLSDIELSDRFWFYFNDQDENNIENLKRTIAEIDIFESGIKGYDVGTDIKKCG